MSFQLTGPITDLLVALRSMCYIQILACNLITGQTRVLAVDKQRLQCYSALAEDPERPSYLLTCEAVVEFDALDAGLYQLLGTALLRDTQTCGIVTGPVVQAPGPAA